MFFLTTFILVSLTLTREKTTENKKNKKNFYFHFLQKIESPLKTVGPPGSLVGTKYIKNSREFFKLFVLLHFCTFSTTPEKLVFNDTWE